jgi:protein-S-isoprenylcysteine O-methyltransferase Ste14
MQPLDATFSAWGLFALSWLVAAFWADRAAKRPAWRDEWLYRIVTIAAVYLLFRPAFPHAPAAMRLWALHKAALWALFAVAVAGFAFAWWARLYLGRLWSSAVTRKADHRIVDTGPYALVRHPIYTGLLLAAAATAGEQGTAQALAGFAALGLAFWIKARLEERFLSEELGADAYAAYRGRVPMLIPFGPRP